MGTGNFNHVRLSREVYSFPSFSPYIEQQVQPHLEQLMKDLVCCSLDVNIPVQSDAAERRLFDRAVGAIDYYCPVRPPTPTKSVFLWLVQLSPLVGPSTDSNRTKSKSLSDNCGKSNGEMSNRVGGEELVIEEELVNFLVKEIYVYLMAEQKRVINCNGLSLGKLAYRTHY